MIQRVVLIKLGDRFGEAVAQVAEHSVEVLSSVDEVGDVRAVVASDERTSQDWDLCLLLQFNDLDAVERYRTDHTHRKYVDVYLRPMTKAIKAYNFTTVSAEQPVHV